MQVFESSEQSSFIQNGMLVIEHHLGARPRFAFARLRCVIPEHGYNIGDETDGVYYDGTGSYAVGPIPVRADSTNLVVVYGDYLFGVVKQELAITADWEVINPENWRLILRAIK